MALGLSFPPFRLDMAEGLLWRAVTEVKLRGKPFARLKHLAMHPQRLVTQEDLTEAVWGNVATSENLVRTHLYEVRHVIGNELIETVIGRGYRFIAEVREIAEPAHV